ncbi:MAG: hypothetical protein ACT4N5_01315 [Nitrosopumilaceae archaeon]
MNKNNNLLQKALLDYSKRVVRYTNSIKSKNSPDKKVFLKLHIRKFSYFNGLLRFARDPVQIEKNSWERLRYPIAHEVKESNSYKDLEKLLKEKFSDYPEYSLVYYTQKLVNVCLQSKLIAFYSVRNMVNNFLDELGHKPVKIKIRCDLTGIALTSNKIQIDSRTTLGRIKKSDLEREVFIDEGFESIYAKKWLGRSLIFPSGP